MRKKNGETRRETEKKWGDEMQAKKKRETRREQSPLINHDRDQGTRESGGYRLGHCALGYRGWSILST